MSVVEEKNKTFDKGLVTEIHPEDLPPGTASDVNNFLDLGDRIELVRGQQPLGNEVAGSGRVLELESITDVAGTEHIFKIDGTTLRKLNTTTDVWDTVKSDLTDDEDATMVPYRTPAGSFAWFSNQVDGLYRINMANPTDVTDFYDAAKNHKGFITIDDNRMFLWNKLNNETVLYLSHIDDDWPYTTVTGETIETGNGSDKTFAGTITNALIAGRTLNFTDTVETFTDDGSGVLTGDQGGTGTINYTTGAWTATFITAPTNLQDIDANYTYEKPKVDSVADFTFSATRLAAEGSFLPQFKGSDPLRAVLSFDEKFYCFHGNSIWRLDLKVDDTEATNKIFRENTGVPNHRAAVSTGEGIYYIDDSDEGNKKLRLLEVDRVSSKIIPNSVSDRLDLNDFDFTDSAGIEFGDFIIFAAKSSGVSYNDTLILYNRKWKLFDKMDGLYRTFTVYNDKLYGGSSVNDNVYQIFVDFDDNDSIIQGQWTSHDWDLNESELKKCKRFVVEGDIAETQNLLVEVSYDDDDFIEIGQVAGDSDFVMKAPTTEYGRVLYGGGTYGSGGSVTAHRFMREFRLRSKKFQRARVRFRNTDIGYLSVNMFIYRDIRKVLHRVPAKFR
jgi:hypothetical protein